MSKADGASVPAQRSNSHNLTQPTIDLKTTFKAGTMHRHPIADRGHAQAFRTFNNGPRAMRNLPRSRCVRVTQIALEPRPFQELHEEREELLRRLNAEDNQALALYQRLVYCDDRMQSSKRRERDAAQSEQRWVRRRMEESIEIQRAVLSRLSEVYIEIQSRERWGSVWNERIVEGRAGCSRWGWEQPAEWSRPVSRGQQTRQSDFAMGSSVSASRRAPTAEDPTLGQF